MLDLISEKHETVCCVSTVYVVTITTLKKIIVLIILAFQLKVQCICKAGFNNLVHHRATEDINSDKLRGNKRQDMRPDSEEMHINPGPDLISSKRTNAILLYFLACFEYCLSLSVQIMSLLEIIYLQMKGNSIFSIDKC